MTGSSSPLSAPPRQLDALTGIRGLAAWYVVLFHTRMALLGVLSPRALALAGKGYLAVDLFFILSGFVMWHSWGDKLRGSGLEGALRFWWRRIARIWPLQVVVLAAFVALAGVLAATGRNTDAYPWAELPLHLLLVQNWGLTSSLSWNDPAWSISCEMGAYVVFPLVVALVDWNRLASRSLLLVALLLLAGLWAYFAMEGAGRLGEQVSKLGLMRCLLEFWLGNVLRLLWGRWNRVPGAATAAWLGAVVALLGGLALGWQETSFIPACFAALILALALDRGLPARVLGSRLLTYLGEISYSTYLVHFLLFVLFKLAFVRGVPQIGWGQLVAYLALVLAASVALYHGVEKPAQRWLNGLWNRKAPPLAAAE